MKQKQLLSDDDPPKLYLRLFHGRNEPNQQLEDWGEDGPIFGPLQWFHVTYNSHYRFALEGNETGDTDGEFRFYRDLLYYNEKYYGDWSLFMATKKDLKEFNTSKPPNASRVLVEFEQSKATLYEV